MNSLLAVATWVLIGWFVAWIGTKVLGDRDPAGGVANIAVGVLGALVGGFATRSALGVREGYDVFILCGLAASIASATLIGLTQGRDRRRSGTRAP